MELDDLITAINADRVTASRHSRNEATADDLVLGEIYLSVVESGEMIEAYTNACPTPAYLILGFNTIGAPIHSVWSYDQVSQHARLITIYRPDSNRWLDWRIRR